MKHGIICVLLTLVSIAAYTQGSVGIGTTSPHASALLDVESLEKGVLVPRMSSAQRTIIPGAAAGLLVYDTDTQSFWHYSGTAWKNLATPHLIADTDGDTRIETEAMPDEDMIRFTTGGTEYFRMDQGRLQVFNTGNSILIGDGAGTFDNFSNNRNIFIGTGAGFGNVNSQNTGIGHSALASFGSGSSNTAIGSSAMSNSTGGSENTAIGLAALNNNQASGNTAVGTVALQNNQGGIHNTATGHSALLNNTSGNFNTALGWGAGGINSTGSGNVFLGFMAGYNETGSDKLYIANSPAGMNAALIYGDFNDGLLRINGTLNINGAYALPTTDGVAGQVLQTNGSGILTWQSAGGVSDEIRDADGDTRVMVEKFADEDRIRFDLGGTEHFVMDGPRLEIKNSGFSVFIGEGAGSTDNLTDNHSTFIGYQAGHHNLTGNNNTALGSHALFMNIGGVGNTAIGTEALQQNTGGWHNTACGNNTLNANTSGWNNTAGGSLALFSNISGTGNSAFGKQALFESTTGFYNTAVGNHALRENKAGSHATAIGAYAMQYAYDGSSAFTNFNVAVGYEALRGSETPAMNTGNQNTAAGYQALNENTSGNENTGTGYQAIFKNTAGQNNTAFGSNTLHENTTGSGNTAVGREALYYAQFSGNTAVGNSTGSDSDNSENCTYIGFDADNDFWMNAYSNSTALGNAARMTASNQVRLGNASVSSIGGFADWSNISDARFKSNVHDNVPGLAFIEKLRPVTYHLDVDALAERLNADSQNGRIGLHNTVTESERRARDAKSAVVNTGFLAQEVEAAALELGYDFSGVDAPANATDLYGLRYGQFVVPLVKAVQELSAHTRAMEETIAIQQEWIAALQSGIATLQDEINVLKDRR